MYRQATGKDELRFSNTCSERWAAREDELRALCLVPPDCFE
jgi:hypothetical protein